MNNEMEVRNAVIESVTLTVEDHGCLQGWLQLDLANSLFQGFGGYSLGSTEDPLGFNGNIGSDWIIQILEVAGVTKWSDLPGKTIRVRGDRTHIDAIGHIIKDIWFCPRERWSRFNKERKK